MLKLARRQRKVESNRIGRVKSIKNVAAAGAVVGLGAVGVGAVGVGAGVGAIRSHGASRNLQKMDAGYQRKMAEIKDQNEGTVAYPSGSGYAQPIGVGGVRGPAATSP